MAAALADFGFGTGPASFGGGGGTAASTGGMGSFAGPLIGAGVGGITGAVSDNEKKKARERDESNPNSPNYRPKNRRLTQLQTSLNAYRQQKLAGQMALSQAAFQWADSLRI